MMQANLQPAELAYLLHSLGAKKVVGVDNAQLFPDDDSTRDDLLRRGLDQLLAHGWFITENNEITSNPRLMLLAAVVAGPNLVLTATFFPRKDAHQTITYYLANGLTVEQFLTTAGDYQLAQLETPAALAPRLAEIFTLPADAAPQFESLTFEPAAFESALSQARSGNPTPLEQAIRANGAPADALDKLTGAIATLQPVGKIEGAALAGDRLLTRRELGLLRDRAGQPWLVYQIAKLLVVTPASRHHFKTLLPQFIEGLTREREIG